MIKKSIKKAFTLAETLVALLIVGLISALIIPLLQYGYKVNSTQTAFVDAMSDITKGIFNYSNSVNSPGDNLSSMFTGKLSEIGLFSANGSPAEKLASQFSPQKTGTNCWNNITIKNRYDASGAASTDLNNLPCFIDGDNTTYAIETLDANCSENLYNNAAGNRHKLKNSCAILYIDLNAEKSPNAFGNDVFAFIITDTANNYLYPVGGKLMSPINNGLLNGVGPWTGSCNPANKDGRACAGRVIEEGIKIKYWK